MNRFAVSAAILSVLALGACASEPEPAPMAAAPAAAPVEAPPPAAEPVNPPEPEKVPFQVADSATGKVIPAGESTTADMPKEPVTAAAPAKPTVAAPDKRTVVYLASYKTEAGAQAGWKVLAKASPILAKQKPVTQNVDLGAKGKFVRLYGMAADEAERTAICKQVGKRVDECGARNRE
jgi:hypothetical protein